MKKLDTTEFVRRATKVHGGRYGYGLVTYERADKRVRITCHQHGEFTQRAADHLRGRGCRSCRADKLHQRSRPAEEYLKKARERHGDQYDYDLSTYANCKSRIAVTCHTHGQFIQVAAVHLRHGCRKCGWARTRETRIANGSYRGHQHSRWISDREEAEFRKRMSKMCNQLVRYCLRSLASQKRGRSRDLLGYTPQDLRDHLLAHPRWSEVSVGEWQVDHIFPVKAFVDHGIYDLSLINSLSNLQPISKIENLRKKDRYDINSFLSYLSDRGVAPNQTSPSSPRSTSSSSASLA